MKLSPHKATLPGPKQVFRGSGLRDLIGTRSQTTPEGTRPLLHRVMSGGLPMHDLEPLCVATYRFRADCEQLGEAQRRLARPKSLHADLTPELCALTERVDARLARC